MPDDPKSEPQRPGSPVEISDLLGLREPLFELIRSISRGVGELWAPSMRRRHARDSLDMLRAWRSEVESWNCGSVTIEAELDLDGRARIRVQGERQRQQRNRELVAIAAIEEARSSGSEEHRGGDQRMYDEWIDRFWRLAQDVSDGELQGLWGRVLTREARYPGSVSLKTLEVLSLLTRADARELERLAGCTVNCPTARRGPGSLIPLHVPSEKPLGPAVKVADEQIRHIGERLRNVVGNWHEDHFGPLGIFSESGWAGDLQVSGKERRVILKLGSRSFQLRGFESRAATAAGAIEGPVTILSGIAWTRVGREIASLIRVDPHPELLAALRESFALHGFELEGPIDAS